MSLAVDDAVADLQPSSRLVHLVIVAADEPLTTEEIATRTHLHKDTVRKAVRALQTHSGLVTLPDLNDGRCKRHHYP